MQLKTKFDIGQYVFRNDKPQVSFQIAAIHITGFKDVEYYADFESGTAYAHGKESELTLLTPCGAV